jgi:hypothetical protein
MGRVVAFLVRFRVSFARASEDDALSVFGMCCSCSRLSLNGGAVLPVCPSLLWRRRVPSWRCRRPSPRKREALLPLFLPHLHFHVYYFFFFLKTALFFFFFFFSIRRRGSDVRLRVYGTGFVVLRGSTRNQPAASSGLRFLDSSAYFLLCDVIMRIMRGGAASHWEKRNGNSARRWMRCAVSSTRVLYTWIYYFVGRLTRTRP